MRIYRIVLSTLLLVSSLVGTVNAGLITSVDTTATGSFKGSLLSISDGIIPVEKTRWSDSKYNVYWTDYESIFTIDFGQLYAVDDIVVSVDNNDNYEIQYSADGNNWISALFISAANGDIWSGMETFSTISGDAGYEASFDFADSFEAQYLKIYAVSTDKYGVASKDNLNSVGELQAFGTVVVPEPGTMMLFGVGIAGIAGLIRRKKNS